MHDHFVSLFDMTVVSIYTMNVSMCKKAAATTIFVILFEGKKTEERKRILDVLRGRAAGDFQMMLVRLFLFVSQFLFKNQNSSC